MLILFHTLCHWNMIQSLSSILQEMHIELNVKFQIIGSACKCRFFLWRNSITHDITQRIATWYWNSWSCLQSQVWHKKWSPHSMKSYLIEVFHQTHWKHPSELHNEANSMNSCLKLHLELIHICLQLHHSYPILTMNNMEALLGWNNPWNGCAYAPHKPSIPLNAGVCSICKITIT